MCSIAGIISPETNSDLPAVLQKMNAVQQHRGPNGAGTYINEQHEIQVGFAHHRLAILDLSDNASQPFRYLDRYVLVFNGAIYNYEALRITLQSRGYTFRSTSDTEVLVAAYDAYGEDCLGHFDGMFAFAIWDEQKQKLFCARDRFGEKPFHYHYNSEQRCLYFASEIKGLFAAGIQREPDPVMLYNYLTLGSTKRPDQPEQTFYQGVFQLAPAHQLVFEPHHGDPVVSRYWDLDKETVHPISEQDAIDQFNTLLRGSIQKRLRSDVPVGSSLSGGLDSSSIVALAADIGGAALTQHCFSAVFPGFGKDESPNIERLKKALGLTVHTVTPGADEFCSRLGAVLAIQDEPVGSASVFAQYMVYEMAGKQGVRVLLDGQGADEVLAGYPKYTHWFLQEMIGRQGWRQTNRDAAAFRANGFLPAWSWKNRAAAMMPYLTAKQLEKKAIGMQRSNPYLNREFTAAASDTGSIHKPVVEKLNDIQYADLMVQGLEELLRYADRNAMAHGLEVRLPFLSHELVQWVISLPATFRMKNGYTKWMLRQSMQQTLPPEICWQKGKTGFEPPQRSWLQESNTQAAIRLARQKLVDLRISNRSLLEKPILPQASHEAGNFDFRCLAAGLWL